MIERVRQLVADTSGTAIVYCDGGNKPKEILTYAPLMRPGDLIAAHDYGTEISLRDVVPLYEDSFNLVLDPWVTPTRILMLRKTC